MIRNKNWYNYSKSLAQSEGSVYFLEERSFRLHVEEWKIYVHLLGGEE